MRKIILSVLSMALFLSLTCFPASASTQNPTIKVEDASSKKGEQVSVDISLENNSGLAYLEIALTYPAQFELVSVENGDLISDFTKGKNYLWVADEDISTDGVLATLTFNIPSTVDSGTYTVGVNLRGAYTYDEATVDFDITEGTITILQDICDHSFTNNVCSKCGAELNISTDGKFESVDTTVTGDIKVPLASNGVLVSSIGAGAFKDCASLSSVMVYDNVTEIADDAFDGVSDDFVIKCYEDSPISVWAEENGVNYEIVPVPYGNVNADEATDIFDLIALAKHTVGNSNVIDTRAANTSAPDKADRTVDIFDLIKLAKHICNPETVLGPNA